MNRSILIRSRHRLRRVAASKAWVMIAAVLLLVLAACGTPASVQPTTAATTAPAVVVPTGTLAAQPTPASVQPTTSAATLSMATPAAPAQTTAVQANAPACTSPAAVTPAVTEGPYFKAGSPERTNLLTSDMPGTRLVLTGFVLTADCKPAANALVDFWQADANGQYDNSGYTLRGHQYADASGRYTLTTVVPGLYPGRTEHIHVKVQAPNGPILTTQLFFPGVSNNESDSIYNSQLLIQVTQSGSELSGTFNFVVSG